MGSPDLLHDMEGRRESSLVSVLVRTLTLLNQDPTPRPLLAWGLGFLLWMGSTHAGAGRGRPSEAT